MANVDTDKLSAVEYDQFDGVLALSSALEAGLKVDLYPRQVLICANDAGQSLSFVHGLPATSGLAPVTFAQDKRMRRSMMERLGFPVPKGATFSLGHGVTLAKKFARTIGYPVSVKPAIGDNGIEAFVGLTGASGIDKALSYLSQPTYIRDEFSRAAYGLTELREPGYDDEGNLTVPPGYMFLLEKHPIGRYVRFLVIDGKVVSAIDCNGIPSTGGFTKGFRVLEDLDPQTIDLVSRAAKVIPGLDVVSMDLIIPNLSAPLREQEVFIVEFSERPGLWLQHKVDVSLAFEMGREILATYAANEQVVVPPSNETRQGTLHIHALPDAEGSVKAISQSAKNHGIEFSVAEVDQLAGSMEAQIKAQAIDIALFMNALLGGEVDGIPAMRSKFVASN
ncbi:hypothetical protein AUR04nite_12560 [Glutamicibacter uratoxydans]|uniref:ATP-grasp domain-containing protein n=1 Tax=Glutamicibacter uratoxydans TaxID=43667 RepID=A0A4Y4DPA8_GLUUR|nr:hypothetical protein [Glutamicibacter uratoxydans]GED05724.1 hypothetical protein AUR04nite_12560 [Glutamicibacter uratoxydans]